MKNIPLTSMLLVSISIALYVGLQGSDPAVIESPVARIGSRTKISIPYGQGQSHGLASPGLATPDLDQKIEVIRVISRKALPTKDEAHELKSLLSDKHLQDLLFLTLASGDHSSFNTANERDRMEMVGLLHLMVMQKNLDGRQEIISRAVERVTSVDFKAMKDLKQKQSVFGDVVEIMKVLKRLDPEAYEAVRSTVAGSQEKALNHALYVAG